MVGVEHRPWSAQKRTTEDGRQSDAGGTLGARQVRPQIMSETTLDGIFRCLAI